MSSQDFQKSSRWLNHCGIVLDVKSLATWTLTLLGVFQSPTEAAHADQSIAGCEMNRPINNM